MQYEICVVSQYMVHMVYMVYNCVYYCMCIYIVYYCMLYVYIHVTCGIPRGEPEPVCVTGAPPTANSSVSISV
jgi:hypothetical protein